jgi:8-oxo-dGTP pyrophosphatase MutT (NUDIX family)
MSKSSPIWQRIGIVLFWLTYPMSWSALRGSKRTRILIVCGNYVVVTKRWLGEGKWSLPGGGLHKAEESSDGALREVREETALQLKSSQLRKDSEQIYEHHGLSFSYALFTTKVSKRLPLQHQKFELVAAEWIHYSELNTSNAQPDVLSAVAGWWR